MTTNWKELKPIVTSAIGRDYCYLSVLDEEGTILLANARMQKELSLENPRKVKSNFLDMLHPVHIEEFKNALQNSGESGNPCAMEFYLKNGAYHPMKWQVNYLPGKKGDVKTFLCRGAFKELHLFSGHYNNAFNRKAGNILNGFMRNSPNLTWVVNEDAGLEFANSSFLQYFGLDEAVLNKKIADFIPPSVVDALYEMHEKVLQTGLPAEIIDNVKATDGTNTSFRITIFPIENAGGKRLLGGLASFHSEKEIIKQKLDQVNERIDHLQRITSDAIWEWDMKTGEIVRNDKLAGLIGFVSEDNRDLRWWLSRVH
ncbi:MAG TPA: PAS domain-containing protein, partial [Chitinophagaceae bacterium]|nr:PAS domain-containing protein [Chitinophagaceae bacterium]